MPQGVAGQLLDCPVLDLRADIHEDNLRVDGLGKGAGCCVDTHSPAIETLDGNYDIVLARPDTRCVVELPGETLENFSCE